MPPGLNVLGGLAGAGAQGAQGAFEGLIEGEALRRKFQSQDLQNQLHMLQAIMAGQRAQMERAPSTELHNGILYRRDPMQGTLVPVGPAPQAPLNPLQQEQAAAARASAALHTRQAEEVGQPRPQPEPQLDAKTRMALEEWRADPKNKGRSLIDFWKEFSAAQHAPAADKPHVNIRHETDSKGHVREIVSSFNAGTGQWDTKVRDLGLIGKPQREPVGAVPRETTTTTTKITPRKAIRGEAELAALNASVPEVINQLSRKPGFNVPGAYAVAPNGQKRLKTDVIKEMFRRMDPPLEVDVFWDGRQFRIARAWEPEQRAPVETRRTTGPPGATGTSEEDQ